MIRCNPFGQYGEPKKTNEGFGDVGLIFPVLLLVFVVGSTAALCWWKKKKDDKYEIIGEEIKVSPLEGSESLRVMEETITQRKGKRRRY